MSDAGWFVYVLRCRDGSLYTGISNDVPARVARHDAGKGAAYTRARRPVTLLFQEPAADKGAALRREAAIKRLRREEKLRLVSAATSPARSARSSRSRPGGNRPARAGSASRARPPRSR